MWDSFEIDCIEETSLHAYFNTFCQKQASRKCEKKFLKVEYIESIQELIVKYVEHFSDKIM